MHRRFAGTATWWSSSLLLSALVLGYRPAPLAAQVQVGPSLGAFWPQGGWTQDFGGYHVERRHLAALMLGGRVAYWPTTRWGLEGAVSFAPSQVAVSEPDNTQDITAGVILSSVRALLRLATLVDGNEGSGLAHWDINVGAGAGIIARRGSAWNNVSGTTHPAAVLVLETRTDLARTVTIRAGLEDFVSWVRFNRDLPSETHARLHHDLVITIAMQVHLGGRAVR